MITAFVICCGVAFFELGLIIILSLCLKTAYKENKDWTQPLYPADIKWRDNND